MSHNSSGGHVPYISSHTSAVSVAGVQNILITGFGLSPATSVAIDPNLGALVSRSFAKTSATSGTITLSVNVSAPPAGSSANRTLTVSHGGYPVQGTGVTGSGVLTVQHGFNPADIASLQAWFDASDVSSITKDSAGLVSQWSDKSGNSYHATQSSATLQPKYFASGGGIGAAHIRIGHDNTNNYLVTPSINWAALSDAGVGNFSIFAVFHAPNEGVGSTDYSDLLRSSTITMGTYKDHGTVYWWSAWRCQGGTAISSLSAKTLGGWVKSDSALSTRINGSVDATQSFSTGGVITLPVGIGQQHQQSGNLEISELLIFNTELTGTDLSDVESYLNSKWSIY